jgi:hypothetical protein
MKDEESTAPRPESSAQSSLTAAETWQEPAAPEALSRREVANAFESWREEVNAAPSEVAGPAKQERESGFATRAFAGEAESAGVEAKRRRAGAVVKENIMPRVERIRDEALFVLEETPDDAGLRFVVIAVVLFLLFLLLLFLSTMLR